MVLTPQMAISHLVMTIGVGISQKKNIKNFEDVQILWNDPYGLFVTFENEVHIERSIEHWTSDSPDQGWGGKEPLMDCYNILHMMTLKSCIKT